MLKYSLGFILKKDNNILINNTTTEQASILKAFNTIRCNEIIKRNDEKYRVIIETDENFSIYYITSDKNHLKSNKLAISEALSILHRAQYIENIIENEKQKVRSDFSKFTHNLKTLCTMSIQDIEYFTPNGSTDDFKISSLQDWNIFIAELDDIDKPELAKTLMRIYKNMQHVQNDIIVYENLFSDEDLPIKKSHHSVHKVITRSVLCCASLLLEKDVRILLPSNSDWPIKIDYTSIQVALFYIMDNIIKYIKPKTDLKIFFEQNKETKNILVKFTMNSLSVDPHEEKLIFNYGYSGNHAKRCNLNGHGIGMHTAERLLKNNGAGIQFISSTKDPDCFLNRNYSENTIIINFPQN